MIWTQKTKPELPNSPVVYPVGTYVQTEKGYFYIASGNKRFRLSTLRVLQSYSPQRVVLTTEKAVSKYKVSGKLKFRSGSLIYNLADGTIFLIENGVRRPVTNPDALTRIGAKASDAVVVSKEETNLHEMGEEFK